jgi:WD40 repeat protein
VTHELTHSGYVSSVAMDPEGKWVAIANETRTPSGGNPISQSIRLWNIHTGEPIQDFLGESRVIAVSPDGNWLVTTAGIGLSSTSMGGLTKVRASINGRVQTKIGIPSDTGIFSTDSRLLAKSQGKSAWVWVAQITTQDTIKALAISHDDHWIASATEKSVSLWPIVATGPEYIRFSYDMPVHDMGFLQNDHYLVIVHGDVISIQPWQQSDLVTDLCARITRELMLAEWTQYIPGEPFRRTCQLVPRI